MSVRVLVASLFFVPFFLAWTNTALAQNVTATHIETHHDKVPRVCAIESADIVSVGSGPWHMASTWSTGVVPTATDSVGIAAGHTVTLSGMSNIADCMEIHGTLAYDESQNTKLQITDMIIMPVGTFTMGTPAAPVPQGVTAELLFTDSALDLTNDPEQWLGGLIAFGTWTVHGHAKTPFLRVTQEPKIGDTSVTLAGMVTGWEVGDTIYIPDTQTARRTTTGANYSPQWEERTIATISTSNGQTTVSFTTPLVHNHLGGYDAEGVLNPTMLPHVANLTRNVMMRTQTPAEVGKTSFCKDGEKIAGHADDDLQNCVTQAHTAALMRADVDVRHAGIRDLGRTTTSFINNTVLDGNGNPTAIGSNQIARYPFHTHHLTGPLNASAPAQTCNEANLISFNPDACQFAIVNTVFTYSNADHIFKWTIAIHGSHYGLIQDTISIGTDGAAIVAEDGTETKNVFDHNFVARTGGLGLRAVDHMPGAPAVEGTAFWFRGPDNYVRNNVAVNNHLYGFTYFIQEAGTVNCRDSALVEKPGQCVYEVITPAWQGADPHMNSIIKNVNSTPLAQFEDNEIYGGESGMTTWWLGVAGHNIWRNVPQSVVKNLTLWNYSLWGFFMYPSHNLLIDNLTAYADIKKMQSRFWEAIGVTSGDYQASEIVIANSDIQGNTLGWHPGLIMEQRWTDNIGSQTLVDSNMKNYVNMDVLTQWTVSGPLGLPGRDIVAQNVLFDEPNVDVVQPQDYTWDPKDVEFKYSSNTYEGTHHFIPTTVTLTDYQQVPGQDYLLYDIMQRPDAPMSPTHHEEYTDTGGNTSLILRRLGCPEEGLTTTQCWDRYRPEADDGTKYDGSTGSIVLKTDPNDPGITYYGEISPCLPGDPNECSNALNSSQNDPQGLLAGITNGDIFALDGAVAENVCLQVELQPRKRKGHNHRLQRARVTVTDQATQQVVADVTQPLDTFGRLFITDPNILSGIANDQSTMYDLTIKPWGHKTQTVLSATDLYTGCSDMGVAIVGDFNENNDLVDLAELVMGVSFYQGVANAMLSDIYPGLQSAGLGMRLADLVELVANYVGQG